MKEYSDKSMTGFGRSEVSSGRKSQEMKAVNHRYCDISVSYPKLSFFEVAIETY